MRPEVRNFLKRSAVPLAAALSLALIYGASLTAHMRAAADPLRFTDDARIWIYPFVVPREGVSETDAYVARYTMDLLPIGYRAFYEFVGAAWDPAAVSKALPYMLLLIVVLALGATAARFAGWPGAWAAAAFALSTDAYLEALTGGLPRSFAFPLLACGAAALAHGRVFPLAAVVCLGAAFYPVVAVPAGLALFAWLFLYPASERAEAATWSLRRRLAWIGVAALTCGALLLPGALAQRAHGRRLVPADAARYPESGAHGRFWPEVRSSHRGFHAYVSRVVRALSGSGRPWVAPARSWAEGGRLRRRLVLAAAALTGAAGFLCLLVREAAARRLLLLLLCAYLAHALSLLFYPHLYYPKRYADFVLPIFGSLLFPVGAAGLPMLRRRAPGRGAMAASALVASLGALIVLGGRGSESIGLSIDARAHLQVYDFIRALPPDSVIAGWPGGVVDNIPYLCRREVLVARETHQVFHRGFVEHMRERTRSLIDAYYARDPQPLVELREKWRVSHLLVDVRHYQGEPPSHFEPFQAWARESERKLAGREPEALRQVAAAGVFSSGPYRILELKRIQARSN